MLVSSQGLFAQLAKELIAQGDNERAKKVLAYAEQVIPGYNVPETHESGSYDIATAYAALGGKNESSDSGCTFDS